MTSGTSKAASPDPIKDAILSASGNGWSPLRIAKHDSPVKPAPQTASLAGPQRNNKQGLGRRQSSSYNHVRSSNLVSNSPFKAGGADGPLGAKYRPSPQYKGLDTLRQPTRMATGRKASGEQRRVSAERRTKSYENAHPTTTNISGTPRRPSKNIQKTEQRAPLADNKGVPELPQKDVVVDAAMDLDPEVEPPTVVVARPATPPRSAVPGSLRSMISIIPLSPASRIPVPTGSAVSQSPKSNLVSKRLLGPRSISGSSVDSTGAKKRRRRKTVTFDPRCDVVEFSADEDDEMDQDNDDYGHDDDDVDDDYMETDDAQDDSLQIRSADLDGFVESILAQDLPGTPHVESTFLLESATDAENGVPYGRSHHADRQREHRQSLTLSLDSHYDIDNRQPPSSADISLSSVDISPLEESSAPDIEVEDGVPYGRSHHVDRQRRAHELEIQDEQDAEALPGSPSPGRSLKESVYPERLVPTTTLPHPAPAQKLYALDEDPFALPDDINPTNEVGLMGSVRSPRISREEVLRRLERKRAGGEDSDAASSTPNASQGGRVASSTPPVPTPTRRLDKPLPIAPGPPLIAIPRFDGDVSFSDSINFDDMDEKEEVRAIHKVSALDRLMLGVERELQAVEHSPDVASSVEMSTPALDILSSTEEESCFEPSTPATPAGFAPAESGAEADGEEEDDRTLLSATFSSSRDMDVDSPEMAYNTHGGMLALPQPSSLISGGADRPNKSSNGSTRSTASTASKIAQRAASIRQKKRERRESDGRPRPRRSMSVADAEDMNVDAAVAELEHALSLPSSQQTTIDAQVEVADIPLSESIDNELRKRLPEGRKYRLRETPSVVYAADDKVATVGSAGDIDTGKAWRTIRRPSDMNEYARQMKELRAQEKPGKSFGKVFVRVVGIRGLKLPVPSQPTFFTCTLNNGIHFVTTPECRLAKDCKVDQEFELIEHPKLEFTLTIKVKRDAHLQAAPAPRPVIAPPPPPPTGSHSKVSGMLAFFGGGSPRKAQKASRSASPALPPAPVQAAVVPEGLARHLKADGTLGRVFVSFADIASRCDTKLFETGFQLVGSRPGGNGDAIVLGELVLQVFRLPPVPGIPATELPQSLDECHRGLRHVNWHKQTYFEGTLTQNGGDCSSWRRRQFRVVGGSLVAYNDVTKKITAKIELKHAVAVHDDDSDTATLSRRRDSADALFQVERSFRVKFVGGEEICFYADSNEEKEQWLEVLKALVGHVPPDPLWAEVVWQRQQEVQQKAQPQASSSTSPVLPAPGHVTRPR